MAAGGPWAAARAGWPGSALMGQGHMGAAIALSGATCRRREALHTGCGFDAPRSGGGRVTGASLRAPGGARGGRRGGDRGGRQKRPYRTLENGLLPAPQFCAPG